MVIIVAGSNSRRVLCLVAQHTCITLYVTSKILVYFFLGTSVFPLEPYTRPDALLPAEKVHIVWGPLKGDRRFRSPIYLTCLVMTLFYPMYLVIVLVLHGRSLYNYPLLLNAQILSLGYTDHIQTDGQCIVGFKNFITIPVMMYDVCDVRI